MHFDIEKQLLGTVLFHRKIYFEKTLFGKKKIFNILTKMLPVHVLELTACQSTSLWSHCYRSNLRAGLATRQAGWATTWPVTPADPAIWPAAKQAGWVT